MKTSTPVRCARRNSTVFFERLRWGDGTMLTSCPADRTAAGKRLLFCARYSVVRLSPPRP